MSVVLPQPLVPNSPTTEPLGTQRSRPVRTVFSPYDLTMPCNSMGVSFMVMILV